MHKARIVPRPATGKADAFALVTITTGTETTIGAISAVDEAPKP